jgi:DNA-binding transcriptional ArsR family regulator
MHMFADMHIVDFGEDNGYIDLAAAIFSLLSDPTRLRIILALKEGELPVGEIADRLCRRQTVISQHLAKMRTGQLVTARHEGTRVFYSLADEHVGALVDQAVYQAEHNVDAFPEHHRTMAANSAAAKGRDGASPAGARTQTLKVADNLIREEHHD